MLSAGMWTPNQSNTVLFVLVDANGAEVTGLGSTFSLYLSKGHAGFLAGSGSKGEVGDGWYYYTATPGEADTAGPIAIRASAIGTLQQNLEYVVDSRVLGSIEFTYTETSTAGNVPLPGVRTAFYADSLFTQLAWTGLTDSFGVARDEFGNKPRLEPGTYYILRSKLGYTFDDPDVEVVS